MSAAKYFQAFFCVLLCFHVITSLETSKNVLFDWGQDTTEFIHRSYKIYPQMRNFHTEINRLNVYITFCIDIAKKVNATLISTGNSSLALTYPTIVPFTPASGDSKRSLPFIWNTWIKNQEKLISENFSFFSDDHLEKPLFVQIDIIPLNFAYCDWPRWKKEHSWKFSVLTAPFERKLWLTLIASFGIFTLVMIKHWHLSVSSTVTLILSVMLSPGLSGNGAKRSSVLFVLWMLCCIVIQNFYCAELTSKVIAPPEEDTFSSIGDLHKYGYKLIFPGIATLEYVKSFQVDYLKELVDKAELLEDDLFRTLALKPKRAIVNPWSVVLRALTVANDIAMKGGRRCFVGKELTPVHEIQFNSILPPGNKEVVKVFSRFMEAGVFQWWLEEFKDWSDSTKVQDRSRVVSPTRVLFPTEAVELKLTGKVQAVFLLWMLCSLGCSVVFGMEMLSQIFNRNFGNKF